MGDEQLVKLSFDDNDTVHRVGDEYCDCHGKCFRIELEHDILLSVGGTEQRRDTEGSNS
jgi:hypothetical protein